MASLDNNLICLFLCVGVILVIVGIINIVMGWYGMIIIGVICLAFAALCFYLAYRVIKR